MTPGGLATFTLGVESLTGVDGEIDWTASVPPGSDFAPEPSAGSVSIANESRVTQAVNVPIPPGTPDGQYLVTFALHTASGIALPDVVAQIEVD